MPKGQLRTRLRNRIAMNREHRGWTQAQLAARLGVSQNTVARWEMDMHVPSGNLVGQLARVLGCRVRDLFPLDFL